MRLLLCCLLAVCLACAPETKPEAEPTLLATFWPTPDAAVARMLQMAELQAGETLYDLGSGDGKIVLAAARDFGVEAVGIEIDEELVRQSRAAIAEAGVSEGARIVKGDLLAQDLSRADVLTVFLTPEAYPWLEPKLREDMRPGMRLLVYKFPIPDWEPVATAAFADPDPEIPTHRIYLYRVD